MWPKYTKPLGARWGEGGHMQASLYWLGIWCTIDFPGQSEAPFQSFSVLFSAPKPDCAFNRLYGWFLKVKRYHVLVNSQPRIMQF